MIRLAQAASAENGGAYGTPPNQLRTGVTANKPQGNLDGELNIIPFYSFGWKAVFRPKDEEKAELIADLAYQIVANGSKVGYGQQLEGASARTGLFDALAEMEIPNPWAIKKPVNCDCSSKTGACVYFAGIEEPALRSMNTTTEPGVLMGTGEFIRLEDAELLEAACGAKRGDIYWKPGHSAICIDTDSAQETTAGMICDCSACNMRTGAGKEYSKIMTLHPGDLVNIVSTASNGWKQIEIGGVYGFVSYLYVKELPKAKAVNGNVWMRTKAGVIKKDTEIMVIPSGATVAITGDIEKVGVTPWYYCIYCGKRGWASGKYIKPL